MNLEELDGFFAALIAEPENVMPSEATSVLVEAQCHCPDIAMRRAWQFLD